MEGRLAVQGQRQPETAALAPKVPTVTEKQGNLPTWIGGLLCRLGVHDYRLIEVVGSFGPGGQVQKVECRRCGCTATKQG
jgi:hypothetical protein